MATLATIMSIYWSTEAETLAKTIADRLEEQRLASGDSIGKYCAQLNISKATWGRLRSGNPGVAMGVLLEFCVLSGKSRELEKVFEVEDLFDLPRNRAGGFSKRLSK